MTLWLIRAGSRGGEHEQKFNDGDSCGRTWPGLGVVLSSTNLQKKTQ